MWSFFICIWGSVRNSVFITLLCCTAQKMSYSESSSCRALGWLGESSWVGVKITSAAKKPAQKQPKHVRLHIKFHRNTGIASQTSMSDLIVGPLWRETDRQKMINDEQRCHWLLLIKISSSALDQVMSSAQVTVVTFPSKNPGSGQTNNSLYMCIIILPTCQWIVYF